MTSYTYLGYGTTGSDGVAKLDHDANGDPISHSYTGSGAGEIDVVASLDDPNSISDSSLQSEPYDVLDTIYYDSMSSDTSSRYTVSSSYGNLLVFDTDGLLFTGGTRNRYFDLNYSQVQNLIGKTVRFEVNGVPSNQFRVGIFPHNPNGYDNNTSDYSSESGVTYLDCSFDDDTIDSCIFRIYVDATDATVKVNDFKIYPI